MSKVSKSIFTLEDAKSQILFDYIDLCFFDCKTYKINRTNTFCCCYSDEYESVLPFSPKDLFFKDKLSNWVYELSLSYIRQSGIDFTKLRLYSIECIKSNEPLTIQNTKSATVVFHFNDKCDGYVTTHQNKDGTLNYYVDDRKYIIVLYD